MGVVEMRVGGGGDGRMGHGVGVYGHRGIVSGRAATGLP
jgi:hypothetical protein